MAIGVALIGSGIFAKEQHLPAILAAGSLLQLKAVYSRSLSSARSLSSEFISKAGEEAGAGVEIYSDETESKNLFHLFQRSDIQAVIIALPIPVQPDVIRLALAAGKHVLAEKPIAKDVAAAEELLKYYKESGTKATLSIAENYRYLDSFVYAVSQLPKLGRVLNFRTSVYHFVKPGGKYIETSWRKVPEYQGGFLLDGGVHFVAATRYLLDAANNPSNAPTRVAAFTNRLQEHLPPIDTVHATWQTKSGITGTYSNSFGTTLFGSEWVVAYEKGTVTVVRGSVTIKWEDGTEDKKEYPNEEGGVKQEVKAWAEGLEKGVQDPRQSPEEALKDLALLEAMIRSGENNGVPVDLTWS